MFVAQGAQEILLAKRREQFFQQYIVALILEARKLGIDEKELVAMIARGEESI